MDVYYKHYINLINILKCVANENRGCTDKFWCLIFLAFFVANVACAGYGLSVGNPKNLLTPYDPDRKNIIQILILHHNYQTEGVVLIRE